MDLEKALGDWYKHLLPVIQSEDFKAIPSKLNRFVGITPSKENVFKAFTLTSLKEVRVVILGQNPYPKVGEASGLAFGCTRENFKVLNIPASLNNIKRELESDLAPNGFLWDIDLTLENWAKQGVLLLNTALTTKEGVSPNIHQEIWQPFIDRVFEILRAKHTGVVYILWGKHAQSYKDKIGEDNYIIESTHPSPLSAYKNAKDVESFFGSKPFSKTNKILEDINNYKINWM
jgi:uracil-DNA glycosylase